MLALKKGAKLQEFVLEDQIGIGSSAIVWKAVDTHLNRNVAIKRPLRQGQRLSQTEMTQFKEEAHRGAKLIHTNIVQVYRVIQEDDDLFLVLEYVDGVSLWDDLRTNALNSQSMPLEQSVWILRDILSGLAFAHGQGICHRDLKPATFC
jgi:eukaryotic-like serine/threonine-protein kinase